MTWQPIHTAPTDGVFEEFDDGATLEFGPDLLLTDGISIRIGWFEDYDWFTHEGGRFTPTHWHSLPDVPARTTRQGEAA